MIERDVTEALFTIALHYPEVAQRVRKLVIDEALARDCDEHGLTEHARLYRLYDDNTVVGEFVEWLFDHDELDIGEWISDDSFGQTSELVRVGKSIQALLGEYFEIDQSRIGKEKGDMLAAIRKAAASSL